MLSILEKCNQVTSLSLNIFFTKLVMMINIIPIEYYIPPEERYKLELEAKQRARLDERMGFKRRDFTSKYRERWVSDFYGLHGEYAVQRFFEENSIRYNVGEKFGSSYHDITHDFIVHTSSNNRYEIGVKTIVSIRYSNISDFFKYKSYKDKVFYPYRGEGSELKGHGYPDFLIYCIYFPDHTPNYVSILGYVEKVAIKNSHIIKLYNKDTHIISVYSLRPVQSILKYLR